MLTGKVNRYGEPRVAISLILRQRPVRFSAVLEGKGVRSVFLDLTEDDLPPAGGRIVPDLVLDLSEVASVRGIVTDPNGSPVSAAKVTLSAGSWSALALTGGDGTFEFLGVPLNVALRLEVDGPQGGRWAQCHLHAQCAAG
jgi:hypothetical protein